MSETVIVRRGRMAMAVAVAAAALMFGGAVCAPIAAGEPNSGTWDIAEFDYCVKQTSKNLEGVDPLDIPAKVQENQRYCCYRSGGVWNGSTCVAPSGSSAGAQQVPGDLQTAPVVVPAPPLAEPPQAEPPPPPRDIPVFPQPPICLSDSKESGCPPPRVR